MKGNTKTASNKKQNTVFAAILAVAVAFIMLGILDAQHKDVMQKAINICLECIGIG